MLEVRNVWQMPRLMQKFEKSMLKMRRHWQDWKVKNELLNIYIPENHAR